MPTYATVADFLLYSEGAVAEDEAQLERWLERAEIDIQSMVPATAGILDDETGLFNTASLTAMTTAKRKALQFATCAQAEFRIGLGPDDRVHWRPQAASGPDFSYSNGSGSNGSPPIVSPKAIQHLRMGGLLMAWARAL